MHWHASNSQNFAKYMQCFAVVISTVVKSNHTADTGLQCAWFPLVLSIVRIGDFYDFPTFVILTTSVNIPSQTSQTVGDFYDVIGRIGIISTLEVHPRWTPTSAIFTISVNVKFACLGWLLTIGDFYNECEHEIGLSGTLGMLDFVFTCYQSLIFSEL